jgi:hypothetical protein
MSVGVMEDHKLRDLPFLHNINCPPHSTQKQNELLLVLVLPAACNF